MGDIVDPDFDPLSDGEFQTLVDQAYSTASSTMQLGDGMSSFGTSSPGAVTPPSSSEGQEEVRSPGVNHDSQAFAQEVSMADVLSHIGAASAGLTSFDMDHFQNIDIADPSFSDAFVNVSSPSQSYTLSQLARLSPVPTYGWSVYNEGPTLHNVSMSPNPASSDRGAGYYNSPTTFWNTPAQLQIHYQQPNSLVTANKPIVPQALSVPAPTSQNHVYQPGTAPTNTPNCISEMAYRTPRGFPNDSRLRPTPPSRVSGRASNSAREATSPYPSTSSTGVRQRAPRQTLPNVQPPLQPGPAPAAVPDTGSTSPSGSSEGMSPKAVNHGGRKGGLAVETRDAANQMRKLGVCWICAFQRDKCDPGEICGRCAFRSQRGQQHLLKCVRIHLQELVTKFLPITMNRLHKRAETMLFVEKNLGYWRGGSSIQVYLTSHGFGHFAWDLHEFEPSSQELLYQRRYLMGTSGTWQPVEKRSPPLALRDVKYTETHKLEAYVERIIDTYLEEFQSEAYSEEEPALAMFQTDLLRALCTLYTSLPEEDSDKNLKGDLRLVLKMLVLTYIMDHAVTILPSHQNQVISRLQCYNDPSIYQDWTSPMMANRQLKYFFSEMQTAAYSKALNRLHQILRTAQDKSRRWMSSFVLMLGIALVLEQSQHLLWIKAENAVSKREAIQVEAEWQARRDCREIDDGYDFLCKLYHCKYRGKHRQKTRFEEWRHQTFDPAEAVFADTIYGIVDRNGGYLMHKVQTKPEGMQENSYASRLVGRFLVELMGLDRVSSSP